MNDNPAPNLKLPYCFIKVELCACCILITYTETIGFQVFITRLLSTTVSILVYRSCQISFKVYSHLATSEGIQVPCKHNLYCCYVINLNDLWLQQWVSNLLWEDHWSRWNGVWWLMMLVTFSFFETPDLKLEESAVSDYTSSDQLFFLQHNWALEYTDNGNLGILLKDFISVLSCIGFGHHCMRWITHTK